VKGINLLPLLTGEDDLTDVLNQVESIAADWNWFGTKLGITPATIRSIQSDAQDVKKCLLALLIAWLQKNYDYGRHGKPSWRKLAEAVHSLNGDLFLKIAAKHG